MAAIRSKGTKPELRVRSALHRAGFRFRLHRKDLPGKPDIVLPRYRVAVFVNGCFWHGHRCSDGHTPKTNPAYWAPKIARNVERDRASHAQLDELGWAVFVIAECELADRTMQLLELLRSMRDTGAAERTVAPGEAPQL